MGAPRKTAQLSPWKGTVFLAAGTVFFGAFFLEWSLWNGLWATTPSHAFLAGFFVFSGQRSLAVYCRRFLQTRGTRHEWVAPAKSLNFRACRFDYSHDTYVDRSVKPDLLHGNMDGCFGWRG